MKKTIKTITKCLAVFLSILFIVEILPTQIMAEAYSDYSAEKQYISDLIENPAESDDSGKAEILYEVTDKRDEHTKVYKRADGTYTALVSQTPLHFMKDGVWTDIDNSLVLENGVLTNADNPFNVTLPERITSNSQITLENDGEEISFAVKDIAASDIKVDDVETEIAEEFEAAVANTKSGVTYEDVADDTDIQYVILPNAIKENIIVSDAESVKNTYSFDIDIGALSYRLNADNSVEIIAADNDVKFTIPAPVMTDSKFAFSYDIGVSVTDNNNGTITLVYSPSKEWTSASERVYPITIDPAIISQQYSDNMFEDTVVCYDSSNPATANENGYDDGLVLIGDYTENGTTFKSEVYTRVNTELLQSLGDNTVITDAQYIIGGIATGSRLYAKALTSSVNMETVTYNTKPNTSNLSVIDYYTAPRALGVGANDTEYLHFNITKVLNDWLNGATNYGIALVPDSDFLAMGYLNGHFLNSSTSSILIFDYVYVNGYNDLYNYHSQDIGRAGVGYVNDFTRSMSLIRNDLSISGNIMPVSIDMIYNPAELDFIYANFGGYSLNMCGAKWLPSYYRYVQYVDETQILYFTETGSEIDFIAQMGENDEISFVDSHADYIGDSGYKAEILEAPENYGGDYLDLIQITRPDGCIERFNSNGALISITNPDYTDQHINIYYTTVSGIDYIDYITDGVGRKYDFVYDSNTHLISEIVCKSSSNVTIKAGTTNSDLKVSYTYDNNGSLTAVTFADGKSVHYTYDSNGLLTSAENIDGYKIVYTYGTDKKVANITEYAFDGTNYVPGNHITYTEIAATQISLSDSNDMTETYFFDSLGRIKYTYDSEGNYYFNSGNSNNDTFFVNSYDYKPLTENFVASPSFETSNGWSGTGYSIITDSSARTGAKVAKLSANNNSTKYISQTINIAESGNYTVSAYVKKFAEVETGDGIFKINIKGYNASNSKKYDVDETIDCLTTDWQRFKATIDNSSHNYPLTKIVITVSSTSSNTEILIDDVQLENSLSATDFNLVEDGSFNLTDTDDYWSVSGSCATVTDEINGKAVKALKFNGGANTSNTALKQISIDGEKDDVFTIGGWFKGDFVRSEPNSKIMSLFALIEEGKFNFTADRYAQLEVSYQYEEEIEGGTTETHTETIVVPYLHSLSEWQFAADSFALKGATDTLYITIRYSKNANSGMFTGVELTYDEDAIVFDETEEPETSVCPCEDCEEPDCPCTCVDEEHCTCIQCQRRHGDTTKDSFGNITSTTAFDGIKSIVTSQSYSADGNYLTSETDDLSHTTSYTVNTLNGIISAITDPNSNTTNYAYDAYNLLTAVYTLDSQNTVESEVQYTYTNDKLTAITHNGFTYNITYDIWGQMTEFAVGSQPIITYNYGINDHRDRLTHVIYHHNTVQTIPRFDISNIEGIEAAVAIINNLVIAGDTVFEYTYYDNGRIETIIQHNIENNTVTPTIKYEFIYDSLGNTISTLETGIRLVEKLDNQTTIKTPDGVSTVYSSYYVNNNLVEVIGGVTYTTIEYEEDNYSHSTGVTTHKSDYSASNSRVVGTVTSSDWFGRTIQEVVKTESAVDNNSTNEYAAITATYDYVSNGNSGTSEKVSHITNSVAVGSTTLTETNSYEFGYEYDANGNIIAEYDGNPNNNTDGDPNNDIAPAKTYVYDNLNQLIRINDINEPATYTYEYDNVGNITSIKKYYYTTADVIVSSPRSVTNYTYDSNWNDRLSSVGNKLLTYDNIGNPITIGSDVLTWEGRNLKSYTKGSKTYNFSYDENGLRHRKTMSQNGIVKETYDYVWSDGKLISQKYTDETDTYAAKFIYSAAGNVQGFIYDNTTYLYVRDLQDDIVAIINEAGEEALEIEYNAWGKITYKIGESIDLDLFEVLKHLSPFTYRGYCYDDDLKLYYLQSRYYSPELCRFINADDAQIAVLIQGSILGANLFAYCMNNPINYIDESGNFGTPIQWACAIIGALIGVPFGKWLANKLGYYSGAKYIAIRAAAIVGGAALGWFAGKLLINVVKIYLNANKAIIFKITSKYGFSTTQKLLGIFGIDSFAFFSSGSNLYSFCNQFLSNPNIKLSLSQIQNLYYACRRLGLSVSVDAGHPGTSWSSYHMHIGKGRIHIALIKAAYDWLKSKGV